MVTSTLALVLHGPMQSWGDRSKLGARDTADHPTRSAVVGMLRAALGDPRDGDDALIARLASLGFVVRVDRPGRRIRDLQNITSEPPVAQLATGSSYGQTIQSQRWYLSDAAFLVMLTGEPALIEQLVTALDRPRWHLSLGRRSCPPCVPFALGTTDRDPAELAATAPLMRPGGDATGSGSSHVAVVVSADLVESFTTGRGGGLASAPDEGERAGPSARWRQVTSSLSMTRPVQGRTWTTDHMVTLHLQDVPDERTDPIGLFEWFKEHAA